MVQGVDGVRHGAEQVGAGVRRSSSLPRGPRPSGVLLACLGTAFVVGCGESGTPSKSTTSGGGTKAPATAKSDTPSPAGSESTTPVEKPQVPDQSEPATNPGEPKTTTTEPQTAAPKSSEPSAGPEPATAPLPAIGHVPVPLFDGKSLAGWEVTVFGGDGECTVENGCLVLGTGVDLTGLKTTRPLESLPKSNYEVTLSARRVEGSDFFCGLTFPVNQGFCSLIVGGWGGGVCGLSCIDGLDAAHNDTTSFRTFENGRWYPVRLRVTDTRIEAWLDGSKIVDQDIAGKKIEVRNEVELSKPLGLASWQTTAAIKDLHIRRLHAGDIPAPAPPLPEGP